MDDLPDLPLKWIPLLAAALAIGELAGVVSLPVWFLVRSGLWPLQRQFTFNLFRGRTPCLKDPKAESARAN